MKNLFILAGGKSSRLGFDKLNITICGKNILRILDNNIGDLFDQKFIVVKEEKDLKLKDYEVIKDVISVDAPLAGVITGLMHSQSSKNFICACDMPFISRDLVEYMLSFEGYDAVVPFYNGYFEPLCCVYSKTFLKNAIECLNRGILSLSFALKNSNIKKISLDEILQFDNMLISFKNINTVQDLEETNEIFKNIITRHI
ncbi:molybdenum cofactor guanylyltransferase [Caldicellulosiruptor morganii]|uniref:Molybdenum cofactor guanylyltransferase n=1 Tax=Caldicellulosiruptor morganii TaxID=1387555 RepID=A0ABY7BJE1_9FIRM|nr:molybdenum cofactor guanylyltransferase [Caldicellulosiruptor morganii]WAM32958.1 molybdenum cofactor guanylyltransferase [Caldicellulosiruptor morganii]